MVEVTDALLDEVIAKAEALLVSDPKLKWERSWDNDTGPNDDYYVEWATVGPYRIEGEGAGGGPAAGYAECLSPEVAKALALEVRKLREELAKSQAVGKASLVTGGVAIIGETIKSGRTKDHDDCG